IKECISIKMHIAAKAAHRFAQYTISKTDTHRGFVKIRVYNCHMVNWICRFKNIVEVVPNYSRVISISIVMKVIYKNIGAFSREMNPGSSCKIGGIDRDVLNRQSLNSFKC